MCKRGYPNHLKHRYKKDTLFVLFVKNIAKKDQNVWSADALLAIRKDF